MTKVRSAPAAYAVLEGHLGHTFRNVELLETALTHKSYLNENPAVREDNERLEFLGDAVLGLAAARLLMEQCPESSEGELSALRSRVVNEQALAALAEKIDLGQWLFLGRGEEMTGGRYKPSLLADAYEAVLGALYLDAGFDGALAVVRRLAGAELERLTQARTQDHKSLLQEWFQGRLRTRPRYEVVSQEGPDHDKVFEVVVYLDSEVLARARGKSKREAEQRAAEAALTLVQLRAQPPPDG